MEERPEAIQATGRDVSIPVAKGVDVKRKVVSDNTITGHGEITLRQSIVPVSLVTILFFMWVRIVLFSLRYVTPLEHCLNRNSGKILIYYYMSLFITALYLSFVTNRSINIELGIRIRFT